MWEITVEFEDEEIVRLTGTETEIPLINALRNYHLFVKEAEGKALYRDENIKEYIYLEEKIKKMTDRDV